MKTLKLVQKAKDANSPAKMSKARRVTEKDDLIDLFPLPRYFQVHFQHVHENSHDLQGELAQLKDYVAKVDEKLERMMALLNRPPEHVL
ncbi:MAG TPA: hypothetical protein VIE65_15865 [Methylobacter sp.]|jgi:hypothetical protein